MAFNLINVKFNKRYVVASSAACFISSIIILSFSTIFLAVAEVNFNIIKNPALGIKAAAAIILLQNFMTALCLVMLFPDQHNLLHTDKSLKVHFQIFMKSTLILMLTCTMFYALAVCFGAPFLSKTSETFHFAALMTTLVSFPCCLVLGSSTEAWARVFLQNSYNFGQETVVYLTSVCSLFGAWFGAFPIPLDWDRPWQDWPISCSLGALGGYGVGLSLAALYLPWRYRNLLKSKYT